MFISVHVGTHAPKIFEYCSEFTKVKGLISVQTLPTKDYACVVFTDETDAFDVDPFDFPLVRLKKIKTYTPNSLLGVQSTAKIFSSPRQKESFVYKYFINK